MSISVLTLFCVYIPYNALFIKLKLFGLYNNIFFMKVSKTGLKPNRKPVCQKNGFNITNLATVSKRTAVLDSNLKVLHLFVAVIYN